MSRLPPPGVVSVNEGDGEEGGRVMELRRLGPLSNLGERRMDGWTDDRERRRQRGGVCDKQTERVEKRAKERGREGWRQREEGLIELVRTTLQNQYFSL